MFRIIIGMVFILFDFFLYVGESTRGIMFNYTDITMISPLDQLQNIIPILPDFIGFAFLFFGMKAEQDTCKCFKQDKKFMIPFGILGYGICLANLYGQLGVFNEYIVYAFGFLSVLTYVYSTYLVANGINFVEKSYSVVVGGKRMTYIWRVFAMVIFLEFISRIARLGEMYTICFIAKNIAGIVFVVYTTQAAILYSERKRNNRL